MLLTVKLAVTPILGAWAIIYDLSSASNITAYVGVALFVAGALMVGRYREALSISERERATLNDINRRLQERNATLEARPNLEQHAELLSRLVERVENHDNAMRDVAEAGRRKDEQIILLLSEIRTAVTPPR